MARVLPGRAGRVMWTVAVVTSLLQACGPDVEPPQAEPDTPLPEPQAVPPPEQVYAPDGAHTGERPGARRVVPAFVSDDAYGSDEVVGTRRVLYRVTMLVPEVLGRPPATVPRAHAELAIDVSDDRLRATFDGAGWAMPPGAQARIRRDEPGAYVFDGTGGRPLGPGQLLAWFAGGRLDQRVPGIRIIPPVAREQVGPGSLICRLVAEWASQPPDRVASRCGEGGTPRIFRVGPWIAERTADVGLRVARSVLRADEHGPPDLPEPATHGSMLSDELIARIEGRAYPRMLPPNLPEPPERGLLVRNHGPCTNMVTLDGIPIGWVQAGQEGLFEAVQPGIYRVGAMRSIGVVTMRPEPIIVPGVVVLSR